MTIRHCQIAAPLYADADAARRYDFAIRPFADITPCKMLIICYYAAVFAMRRQPPIIRFVIRADYFEPPERRCCRCFSAAYATLSLMRRATMPDVDACDAALFYMAHDGSRCRLRDYAAIIEHWLFTFDALFVVYFSLFIRHAPLPRACRDAAARHAPRHAAMAMP